MSTTVDDPLERILRDLEQGVVYPVPRGGNCTLGECRDHDCLTCGECKAAVAHQPDRVDRIISCGACRISSTLGISPAREAVARIIDHTLLRPDATKAEIEQLCEEASSYCFATVCVNPCWVRYCARLLHRKGVLVCTVVGFPLGATSTQTKAAETAIAVAHGAREIDMVINIGWLKSEEYDLVRKDITEVVRNAGRSVPVKVILETCLLTDEEKVKACLLAKEAGAAYVKTSTGFSKSGADAADVALMRRVVGPSMGVKASGGVRSYEEAVTMMESGATRIGASASVKIVTGKEARSAGY
jgi:deoxyribose-phosphate aldolase